MSEKTKNLLEEKTIYRLIPCQAYDAEAMESWLSALAAQGLFLQKDGIFLGVASFYKALAMPVLRYRLDVAEDKKRLSGSTTPTEEILEMYAEMGWEYVCAWNHFHIYRAGSPAAPELNTDPRVQAQSIKWLQTTVAWGMLTPILIFCINGYGILRAPLLAFVELGTGFSLVALLLLLWLAAECAGNLHRIAVLRRTLAQGLPMNHHKDWKKHWLLYSGVRAAMWVVAILWFYALFSNFAEDATKRNQIPLTEYTGTLPFLTAEALVPGAEVHYKNMYPGWENSVSIRRELFAPQVIHYEAFADLILPGGEKLEAVIETEYYEMATLWLAKWMAHDCTATASRHRQHDDFPQEYDKTLSYPIVYHYIWPTVLMRKGRSVIKCQLRVERPPQNAYGEYEDWFVLTNTDWVDLVWQSLPD